MWSQNLGDDSFPLKVISKDPMEYHFPLTRHLLIIHLVCLQMISAESGMRPRTEWRGGGGVVWTINTHQPQVMSRRWRRVSVLPDDRQEYSFDNGAVDKIDHDYVHQGFGGFPRRKASDRDRNGRFNSDTVSAVYNQYIKKESTLMHHFQLFMTLPCLFSAWLQ